MIGASHPCLDALDLATGLEWVSDAFLGRFEDVLFNGCSHGLQGCLVPDDVLRCRDDSHSIQQQVQST